MSYHITFLIQSLLILLIKLPITNKRQCQVLKFAVVEKMLIFWVYFPQVYNNWIN